MKAVGALLVTLLLAGCAAPTALVGGDVDFEKFLATPELYSGKVVRIKAKPEGGVSDEVTPYGERFAKFDLVPDFRQPRRGIAMVDFNLMNLPSQAGYETTIEGRVHRIGDDPQREAAYDFDVDRSMVKDYYIVRGEDGPRALSPNPEATIGTPVEFEVSSPRVGSADLVWGINGQDEVVRHRALGPSDSFQVVPWTRAPEYVSVHYEPTLSEINWGYRAKPPPCSEKPESSHEPPLIVLIHGYGGDASSLDGIAERLREVPEYSERVAQLEYPPREGATVLDHALEVQSTLLELPGVSSGRPIFIVAHSMGGVITRTLRELSCFPAPGTDGHISAQWRTQIAGAILMGTPSGGTTAAHLAGLGDSRWWAAAKDLEPGSRFLSNFKVSEAEALSAYVTFTSPDDQVTLFGKIDGVPNKSFHVSHSDSISSPISYDTSQRVQDCVLSILERGAQTYCEGEID